MGEVAVPDDGHDDGQREESLRRPDGLAARRPGRHRRERLQTLETGHLADRTDPARSGSIFCRPNGPWCSARLTLPGLPAVLVRRRAVVAAPVRYCVLVEPARAQDRPTRWTRGLLCCGLAAGPVFVTTFLTDGATRNGYRPSRHPVSSLALGPRGWVQAANFAVTGTR
jgi:hypothetical protein